LARILVTGASGLLGGNLAIEAAGKHDVSGVFHTNMVVFAGVRTFRADLTKAEEVRRILRTVRPDWVINCAAATDVDHAEREPEWAFRLNRDMPGSLAEECRASGARLLHISTDAIFEGDGLPLLEDSVARPATVYGKSKLAGERAIVDANPDSIIVRSNLFGWSPVNSDSLAEWFLIHLTRGEACPGFTDVFFSPILVNDLAGVLLRMLSEGMCGIYHVGGATCLSKYDFGRRLAGLFKLRTELIRPAGVDEAGLAAPRQKYMCLNSHQIERALSLRLPTIEEGLARFKALAANSTLAARLGLR
jgi:dTDP-4-dehydrorhamnose reductase